MSNNIFPTWWRNILELDGSFWPVRWSLGSHHVVVHPLTFWPFECECWFNECNVNWQSLKVFASLDFAKPRPASTTTNTAPAFASCLPACLSALGNPGGPRPGYMRECETRVSFQMTSLITEHILAFEHLPPASPSFANQAGRQCHETTKRI